MFTGHLDRLIVPQTARFMTEHLPRGRFVRLEPVGHMLVFERHDQLVSDLSGFADSVLTPSGAVERHEDRPRVSPVAQVVRIGSAKEQQNES